MRRQSQSWRTHSTHMHLGQRGLLGLRLAKASAAFFSLTTESFVAYKYNVPQVKLISLCGGRPQKMEHPQKMKA
jgi:hypothetical protein